MALGEVLAADTLSVELNILIDQAAVPPTVNPFKRSVGCPTPTGTF